MKPVAAHALRVETLRDGVVIRDRAVAAMESGVEAGDLRQIGGTRKDCANGRKVMGLMKRRERGQALEIADHLLVYQNRTVVVGTAMHHAMPNGARIDLLLVP